MDGVARVVGPANAEAPLAQLAMVATEVDGIGRRAAGEAERESVRSAAPVQFVMYVWLAPARGVGPLLL